MSIARRWIFPILRILLLAAVAAALIKLAFFGDTTQETDGLQPTGTLAQPQYQVVEGTIRNDLTLPATIASDAPVPIKATLTGEIREVSASAGQWVDAGQELMQIRGLWDDGSTRWSIVTAPISGTLSEFDAVAGQSASAGAAVGKVAPATFSASAPIQPQQQYRLTSQPTEAQVAITGGPAPFTCTGLVITTTTTGGDSGGTATSTPTVRCAVPAGVQVFNGVTAQLTIAGGIAENVLVIPTTAVEGGSGSGIVYIADAAGTTTQREVTLGLSDGAMVQVTAGLEAGETILQFVPGAPAVDDPMNPGGGVIQYGGLSVALLRLRGVTRAVELPDGGTLEILRGIDLDVEVGDHLSIVGRSGSGKSTLLNILGLIDNPTSGTLEFDGIPLERLRGAARDRRRGREIGFVFQQFNLLPRRTALENVTVPLLYASGRQFWQRAKIATAMLERVGLGERLQSTPDQLSGGEQQRVAIARALVRGPRLILADEPTGALDVETGASVMGLLDGIAESSGAALITITHDLSVAGIARRHYRLDAGVLAPLDARHSVGSVAVAP